MPHRPFDVSDRGARSQCSSSKAFEPAWVELAGGVEIEQREALEPLGVAGARTDGEPDRHVSQAQGHAVGPDARSSIDHQVAERVVPGCVARCEAAQQGVGDQYRALGVSLPEQVVKPVSERVDVEPLDRRRLP